MRRKNSKLSPALEKRLWEVEHRLNNPPTVWYQSKEDKNYSARQYREIMRELEEEADKQERALEVAIKRDSARMNKNIERALLEGREISFDSPALEKAFGKYDSWAAERVAANKAYAENRGKRHKPEVEPITHKRLEPGWISDEE